LRRPEAISILNVLAGRVASVDDASAPLIEVQVSVGTATINARITRRSMQQLGIHPGQEIFALVKAVSLDQRSVGYA
jgi:molybdate transport system ATP-binding protein